MEHNHEQQAEKDPAFFYGGGTGAFTILWILFMFGIITWLMMH